MGAQALMDLKELICGPQLMPKDLFLEIPQLMLSFENLELLDIKDLNLIKALGLKFRDERAWPLFRRYKPGFFSYYLDEEEQRSMIVYLEQTVHVLERTKADIEVSDHTDDPKREKFLVRRADKNKGNLRKDHYEEMHVDFFNEVEFDFDQDMLIKYQQRSSGIFTYELVFLC